MRVPLEQRTREYRIIFDLLNERPRIKYTEIAESLNVEIRTASGRLKEAVKEGYIAGPYVRKKSFSNFKAYVYLINSSNHLRLFREYIKDNHVLYHEILEGFCNVRVVSDMNLNIEGTIFGGLSSDYYVSYPPDQPWGTSINNMWDMVRKFNPDDYTPKGYIKTHWDEPVQWNEQDETLFLELKYNLRKPLEPLMRKKYHIWSGYGFDFLERLPHYCTIATSYFPETISAYDPYLYTFETDYEDFIIDLFSKLPTTCWFQRVSNILICHMWKLKKPIRVTTCLEDIPGIQIPLLVEALLNKRIVKKENHARKEYYWRKEVDE